MGSAHCGRRQGNRANPGGATLSACNQVACLRVQSPCSDRAVLRGQGCPSRWQLPPTHSHLQAQQRVVRVPVQVAQRINL